MFRVAGVGGKAGVHRWGQYPGAKVGEFPILSAYGCEGLLVRNTKNKCTVQRRAYLFVVQRASNVRVFHIPYPGVGAGVDRGLWARPIGSPYARPEKYLCSVIWIFSPFRPFLSSCPSSPLSFSSFFLSRSCPAYEFICFLVCNKGGAPGRGSGFP